MINGPSLQEGENLVIWRLDSATHKETWDSGEGAFLGGGRWNPPGVRVLYASLDPATAILEVAAHKGFQTLDTVPHVLSSAFIVVPTDVHVLRPADVPNPHWLNPGIPSNGQMMFGADLLTKHSLVLVPSVVSTYSWNVIFDPRRIGPGFTRRSQEPFALDTRLHPPTGTSKVVKPTQAPALRAATPAEVAETARQIAKARHKVRRFHYPKFKRPTFRGSFILPGKPKPAP